MYKIIDGKTVLLQNYKHPLISNYHLIGEDVLLSDGWILGEPPKAPVDFERLKSIAIEGLKAEKNDNNFKLTVISEARGVPLEYTINQKRYLELMSQLQDAQMFGSPTILWHDDTMDMHETNDPYTLEEGIQVLQDIKFAVGYREAKYDIFIQRAKAATTQEELDQVRIETFTAQEQAYIDLVMTGAVV